MSIGDSILAASLVMAPCIMILSIIKSCVDSASDEMHRLYYEDRKDIPYFREKWGLDKEE